MTKAQWLFEYLALREKEKESNDIIVQSLKAMRHMLISILGLNLMPEVNKAKEEAKEGKSEDSESEDEEVELFTPLSLITGRREVVEHMLNSLQEEETVSEALKDDDFEKMSAAIADGDDLGDMAPLFEVDDSLGKKLNTWFTPGRELELDRLGVKITSAEITDVGHVTLDIESIKEKKIQQAVERRQAAEQVEEQFKKEKGSLESRGVKVTFDDA